MTTRKSHKSRQTQTQTALASASPMVADGVASSDATALTQPSSLPALLAQPEPNPAVLAEKSGAPTSGDKSITVLPPKGADKPIWWRRPDSKLRKTTEKIVVMRTAGRDDAFIAKKLGTTEQNVRQTMYLARKNGWLTDAEDDVIDIEAQLATDVDRQIVRNISASLDGGMTNYQTHEMTIAAAKGRGIFKNHDKIEGGAVAGVFAPVAIQVIMPAIGVADQTIIEENVGGLPAYEDGEVIDVSTSGPDGGSRDQEGGSKDA